MIFLATLAPWRFNPGLLGREGGRIRSARSSAEEDCMAKKNNTTSRSTQAKAKAGAGTANGKSRKIAAGAFALGAAPTPAGTKLVDLPLAQIVAATAQAL